jgi:hypothetical protein
VNMHDYGLQLSSNCMSMIAGIVLAIISSTTIHSVRSSMTITQNSTRPPRRSGHDAVLFHNPVEVIPEFSPKIPFFCSGRSGFSFLEHFPPFLAPGNGISLQRAVGDNKHPQIVNGTVLFPVLVILVSVMDQLHDVADT